MHISKGGSGLPSRVILHGVEGVGKTSWAGNAPSPIFSMSRGETGLLTLIDNGLISLTDHFDEAMTWRDLLGNVRHLIDTALPNKTYVLDTLNGAERLCFEHVTREKFGGDWERFTAYGKGPEIALVEWINFLEMLDFLRTERRMSMIMLCHTRVKAFRNPEGEDYDRYSADMHEKTWGLSHKWADVVLFANFESFAKKDRGALKAKGIGGEERILYTRRTAAYDAKNRIGLPPEIPMGKSAAEGWKSFATIMKECRLRTQAAAQPVQAATVAADASNTITSTGN